MPQPINDTAALAPVRSSRAKLVRPEQPSGLPQAHRLSFLHKAKQICLKCKYNCIIDMNSLWYECQKCIEPLRLHNSLGDAKLLCALSLGAPGGD